MSSYHVLYSLIDSYQFPLYLIDSYPIYIYHAYSPLRFPFYSFVSILSAALIAYSPNEQQRREEARREDYVDFVSKGLKKAFDLDRRRSESPRERQASPCLRSPHGHSQDESRLPREIVIPDSQDDPEIDEEIASDRLRLKMRATIQYLQEYSRDTKLRNLDMDKRPLCLSYWSLLSRIDVDWIMQQLMEAILREVQNLFEKDLFTPEDWLDLPDAETEGRTGIYVFIVMEEKTIEGDLIIAIYVGSSVKIRVRIRTHKEPETWLHNGRSLPYRKLRQGKTAYTGVLAAFDTPIERGYLNLLEGLFIIMLGTLQKPMFCTGYVRPCAWSFVEKIRESIGIPWGRDTSGLNLAFPLVQGFFNKGANEMSPCAHCGMMTGSRKHRKMMEGTEEALHIQFTRFCVYSGDPLGLYRCHWCHDFNKREERLPSKEEVEKRTAWCLLTGKLKWSQENPESGYIFRCAHCGANNGPDNQLFIEKSGRIVCYGPCALKTNIEKKKEFYRNRTEDPEDWKRHTEEWKEWYKKKMEDQKARSVYTKRRRELYRKLMEDPEKRKKCNEKRMKQHKKMMENPDARKRFNKMRAEMRKRKMTEQGARDLQNEKRRKRYKERREDPAKRKIDNAKKVEEMRKRRADPEKKKKDNERRRERRKEDPDAKSMENQKQRELYRKQMEDPEERKRINEMAAGSKRKIRAELKEKKRGRMDEGKA